MTRPAKAAMTVAVEHSITATDAVIAEAVQNGIMATEPIVVGDHGMLVAVPAGWDIRTVDVRNHEDLPRHRGGQRAFVDVPSLAAYVARYDSPDAVAYGKAVDDESALASLRTDSTLLRVVLDEHPANPPADEPLVFDVPQVGHRDHVAALVLRPTPGARRWAKALTNALSQEQFLDLIDDGITEIAEPPGAVLRDLISDLHAIRSSSVKSVIRTGGEASLEVADNVGLTAGTGTKVTVPEHVDLVIRPWTLSGKSIAVRVKIKPRITDSRVSFLLTAPNLEQLVTEAAAQIATTAEEALDRPILWTT